MQNGLQLFPISCLLLAGAFVVTSAAFAEDKPCPKQAAASSMTQPTALDLAYERWMEGLYAEAAQSSNPALQLVAGWWWQTQDEDDRRAPELLRRVAQNPDLDAAGLWSLVDLCGLQRNWDWCDEAAWKQRLLVQAPDNANAWLLQIEPQTGTDGQANWNTPANQDWLSKAASASSMATFQGAHAIALFEFALEYDERNPYRMPRAEDVENESVRELLAQGVDMRALNASTFAVFTPWTYLNSLRVVGDLCDGQWPDGAAEVQQDCQALASKAFAAPRNWMDLSVGTLLTRIRDEGMGNDDHEEARAIANARAQCEMPAWMGTEMQRFNTQNARQYLAELERFGEFEAMRRAAIRDYALHPEAYDHDPAACPQPVRPDLDWALND
jgi:hypothetical protein